MWPRAPSDEQDEAGLVRRAQRGSGPAAAELLRRHQDAVYRFCLGNLGDRDLAMDAAQETALRICQRLGAFEGRARLRTWALGIALNVCREMRRRRGGDTVGLGGIDPPAPPTSRPADAAAAREARSRLAERIERLPPRQREVVLLRYFEQLSVGEAAEVMGCAAGTVKATMFQALRNLRSGWSDHDAETA